MTSPSDRESPPDVGIVLAAGLGSRLGAATGPTKLKPLLQVDGEALIVRVLKGMERMGCRKLIVVVGFGAEELKAELRAHYRGQASLEFVTNRDFRKSNGLSVLAAREALRGHGSFILSMSDHLLGDSLMQLAAQHRPLHGGAALLVDYRIDQVFDLDDATKVVAEGPRLLKIGKQLSEYNCIDTGLFVGTRGLVDALQEIMNERGDASLSEGVARLAATEKMEVLDIGDGFWADIDTPEMLADAEQKLPTAR
jgi:1L-myo-inositol 1-phosphate cytidylyltransferase